MCPAGAGGTARLRQCLGGSSKHQAESGSLALRTGRLASGCFPPRLAATQLPSASQPFRVLLWIGLSPSVFWYVQAHLARHAVADCVVAAFPGVRFAHSGLLWE